MQAMELGRDRVVYFDRQERRFTASDPHRVALPREEEAVFLAGVPEEYRTDEDESKPDVGTLPRTLAALVWTIPQEYRMNQEDDSGGWIDVTAGNEEREVFRFFADGGASGSLSFTLKYDRFERTFSISPLTGRMLAAGPEDEK